MVSSYITSAFAGALLLGFATAAKCLSRPQNEVKLHLGNIPPAKSGLGGTTALRYRFRASGAPNAGRCYGTRRS